MLHSLLALARRAKRAVLPRPIPDMLAVTLRSEPEWRQLCAERPLVRDAAEAKRIATHARRHGAASSMLGPIPAAEVVVSGPNLREELQARSFNPRQRAVMERFMLLPQHPHVMRIYAHEAVTPFGLLFRGRYPLFLGSEYASDAAAAERLFPVPIIDITRSGLPDGVFDCVLSNEVFEHVPDLPAALCDTARILKPGGRLIATFPFAYDTMATQRKAVLEDGQVRHLAEPEYHGNPADPEGGSLVFQIPGWDILDQAREAGFRDPRFVFVSSVRHAITATDLSGILVFEAER